MRFELSGNDVGALAFILHFLVDEFIPTLDNDNSIGRNMLERVEKLFKKLKMYGQSGYDTREDYRNDIEAIKSEMYFQMKRWKMIKDA